MPYRCLAEFLEQLGHAGQLTRVEKEVDPALEIAEMTAQAAKAGGPALLFAAIKGHDLPVLTNLLATEERICRALAIESLDDLSARIGRMLDSSAPEGWFERLKGGGQPAALSGMMPRNVKSAACQQILRLGSDIDLGLLPLLQNAPEESQRAITGAVVFSSEPDSHRRITGRFDLQRIDGTRLAVCWAAHDDHARLPGEYRARGQKMPVAVVIGGDPAFLLAAAAPMPPGNNLCAVAGLLREKPLDMVACRGVDLEVPAEAEIVLEGFVDPAEPPATAGPLCAPLGHCTSQRPAPVMHVTALTHRANPIYAAMVPGPPPQEACTVARAMQRVFLPLQRLAMPELVDYDLPEFAAARHWAAISIHKTYPGQGRRAAHAAWGLRPLMFAKTLIVVDDDVNVRDQQDVLAAVTRNSRPGKDIVIEQGPPDPFDPTTFPTVLGERMALDATRRLPGE
jgi:4-hydroxy-3-polyprenylbenzoate decarboxylase